MKNYQSKTFTRLQASRRWENGERIGFGFLLGAVFTALLYYIAIQTGCIEIIYN